MTARSAGTLVTKTHMQRAAIPAPHCRRRKAEFLHAACSTGAAGRRGHRRDYGWRRQVNLLFIICFSFDIAMDENDGTDSSMFTSY